MSNDSLKKLELFLISQPACGAAGNDDERRRRSFVLFLFFLLLLNRERLVNILQ